jgi:hypothetical protein
VTNHKKIERTALTLANFLKDIITLSDRASDGFSPSVTQVRLLTMHSTIQRNKTRMVAHIGKLTELLDEAHQK